MSCILSVFGVNLFLYYKTYIEKANNTKENFNHGYLYQKLIAAPSCYQGLRDLAEKWLNSKDTPEEAAVTKEYLAALEADVLSIDALIAFAGSEKGIQIFGNEQAKTMVSQAQAAKANGAKYCICPACTAGGAILDKKDEILK